MVIYFYVGIGLALISATTIILTFIWFKKVLEETNIFVRLMIGLYEQEKQKSEKREEGGFGT